MRPAAQTVIGRGEHGRAFRDVFVDIDGGEWVGVRVVYD